MKPTLGVELCVILASLCVTGTTATLAYETGFRNGTSIGVDL
jgi:hypothetical protein